MEGCEAPGLVGQTLSRPPLLLTPGQDGDFYDGDWMNNKPHGRGRMQYADGDVYEGEWKDGEHDGHGTMKDADAVYEGQWEDGERHGRGTCTYPNGDVFEGWWNNGEMHGKGIYTYANGTVREEEWEEGKPKSTRTLDPLRDKIRDALASILLEDDIAVDGVDDKFVSYLASLLHECGRSEQSVHSHQYILRPWLKGFRFDGNLAKECSDAVMQCGKGLPFVPTRNWQRIENDVMFLNVVDGCDNAKERYALLESSPFKTFFENYATSRNVSVRGFKHYGRTLFLSSIGKKTPKDLGLFDGDEIRVVAISNKVATATEEKESEPKQQPRKGKGKKKKHKKSNRKKSMPALPPDSKEEKLKEQHSQALSRVFEEADTQFRDIRQKLAAMNLQRATPKQRRSQPKEEPEAAETITDNPRAEGLGGKAGKSHFLVQVGETSNLYNTRAKPSNGNKQPTGRIAGEVDLHGCTQEEALAKLDECLPKWMDSAMKGEYPWVITVRIVCGGGTQTVAEGVEDWIKRNPNVSNAPKNLYS